MANYPNAIPAEFASDEKLRDAYERGWNHGHGIACHNVPTIGETIWTEGLGKVKVDAENAAEVHQSLCFEAEANSRCYSPFEFTAHEFNSAGEWESEALWEAFDQGIGDAIADDLKGYTYGDDE